MPPNSPEATIWPNYTDGNDLPISVASLKTHARVVSTIEDSEIEGYIRAATLRAELETMRSLGPYTYQLKLDQFPYQNNDLGLLQAAPIRLTKGPVAAVTSMTYLDPSGNTVTAVLGTDYQVSIGRVITRVLPVYNNPWPSAQNYVDTLTVVYTAGYKACGLAIPEDILQAIRLIAATWCDQKNAISADKLAELPVPFNASALLYRYRVRSL